MRKTAEFCKIALGEVEIMTPFDHSSNNLGDCLDLIEVFGKVRIGFSDMIFVVGPVWHNGSPLSGKPIVTFGFCFL